MWRFINFAQGTLFGGKKSLEGKAKERMVHAAIQARRRNIYQVTPAVSDDPIIPEYPKTEEDKSIIVQALSNNFVFSSVLQHDASALIDSLEPFTVKSGTHVTVEGEVADYFYILRSGRCAVYMNKEQVGTLESGNSFGETGLLYDTSRNATVTALVDCEMWKLDRETFRRFVAVMHMSADASKSVSSTLRKAEALQGLSEEKLQKLIDVALEVGYKEGEVIVEKGEEGTLGYFVMEGTIRVTNLPVGIPDMTYGPGDHFGLQALFTSEKRQATVIAQTDVTVIALSENDIKELLGDIKEWFLRDHELRRLKSIPLFSEFSKEMLISLLSSMTKKYFKTGEAIIRQGELGTTFYLIRSGSCDVVVTDDTGKRSLVKNLGPLGYFGEMGLLKGALRSADVIAATDCEVLEVGQGTFQRIFGSSSSFSSQLQQIVKGRSKSLKRIKSPPDRITKDQLKIMKSLGSGSFGNVSLVQDTKTGLLYAVKEMSIKFIEETKQQESVVCEKEAMKACDHPFILKLFSTWKDNQYIAFLMEYCNGGDMFGIIHDNPNNCLPESSAQFYAACEVLALEHCALLSLAYRDLKPENTMIDSEGYAKLIDMGFAKVVTGKTFTFCGTPEYMAPEIILRSGHNRSVDLFALGILIYEMLSGMTPFYDPDTTNILKKIIRGKYKFGPQFSSKAKDLIQNLLLPDRKTRLGIRSGGMADIINHPWFSGINFEELVQKKIAAPWVPPEDRETLFDPKFAKLSSSPSEAPSTHEKAWLNNF